MMKMHRPPTPVRRLLAPAAVALAALVLSSCATAPATPGSEPALVERAQARWNALLASDLDTAYALYSPGYRSAHSRTDYEIDLRTRRVSYKSATYKDHQCEADVCTVNFAIEYRVPRPVPGLKEWQGQSMVHEKWIRADGQWWYVPPE